MNIAPVAFDWDGEVMRPQRHFLRRCHQQYVVGETYSMVPHEERSTNSHNHFFAAVHEAWKNLPERLTARFPNSERLRKWALIKAGYADERSIACETAEEALKVAAFIKPMDDCAVVVVADATIKVYTAKSQSTRAMDRKDFQESKQAVLDIVAELIGVDAKTLAANTNSNSPPEPAPPSGPEATPAPATGPAPAGAGTSSQSPSQVQDDGEERQASAQGNPAPEPAGLPEDWRRQYAAALASATKVGQLPRKATAYWEKHGGWTAHKSGPNADTAAAIYNAFANHFDNPEERDAILHELDAN